MGMDWPSRSLDVGDVNCGSTWPIADRGTVILLGARSGHDDDDGGSDGLVARV